MGTYHPLKPASAAHTDHLVHLYDEDAQYYGRFVEHVHDTMRDGGAALLVVTEDHRRGLVTRLTARGLGVAEATARGQLELCDANEVMAEIGAGDSTRPDRFLELIGTRVDRALTRFPELLVVGEVVDLLAAERRFGAALELEQLWNQLMQGRRMTLRCAYRIRNFASALAGAPFERVCASHGDVVPLPVHADEESASRRHIVARMQQQMYALRAEVEERRAIERRMARHHAVTAALAETLTMRDVAQVAIDALCDLAGPGDAAAYRVADDGRSLQLLAMRGVLDATLPVTTAIASGRAHWGNGLAALPLVFEQRALGGVAFTHDPGRWFAPGERTFLEGLAVQFCQAMERARLFEDEKAARERLVLAERRKDEFLAMLGHELRNPLAPILTAVEVMRLRGDVVHERERAVVERQTRHLVRLVDDLLDLSRITHGTLQLKRRPAGIAEVIHRACEIAGPLVAKRGHALSVELEAGLPEVDVDFDRMAQVVSNLIGNAAKYTPPGGSIVLSARRSDGMVEVAVKDDGVGIRAELLPHVFDLFVQGTQSLDRTEGGLGVGLTLVRQVTELHGGTIDAQSEGPGTGSTFRIRLPVGVAVHREPRANTNQPASRPFRILVVDDNHDSAEMVADVLAHLGHEVAVAHDGPAALARAAELSPDVVLLDLGLPTMDGFEVARQLRARGADAHLVAMTGYGQASDRAATQEAGFDAHLVKPIDVATLEKAIAAASR